MNRHYFLARPLAVFDSPIDALASLCIGHDERMNLVRATCFDAPVEAGFALIALQNTKRKVAAVKTASGKWQAASLLAMSFDSYEDALLACQKQAANGKQMIVVFTENAH